MTDRPRLTTSAGDIDAAAITAVGNDVVLNAAASITDGNGATTNITASVLDATAATGIDLDRLEASFNALILRHQMMRARIDIILSLITPRGPQ